jgi:digeranylgeranylglycerophospholipid reductase
MSFMYDVIIVGAGPAGTCCAKKLAERGFSVKVYDRRKSIGEPKRCGEGVSENIEKLIGKIPERCIAQRIKGARIYAPNGKFLEAVLDQGGFILERKVFDKWLAEEAVKSGAKVRTNSFISDFLKENNYFVGVKGEFFGEPFEEKSKIVVCATGAESALRKKALDIHSPLNLIDSCLQYEMSGIETDSDFIHVYLGNQIAPRGYCWVFPKGKDRANVGVGVMPGKEKARYFLEKFIDSHPELKKGSIIEVNAGCVPVGGLPKNAVSNGLIICGEAANHVNPIHGGGISEAIISSHVAADIISEALERDDFSEKFLSKFNDIWWEKRGKYLRKVEKLREVVEKLSDNNLNDFVEVLKPGDIIDFTRGSKLSVFAKVLMRKPSLVSLAKHLL